MAVSRRGLLLTTAALVPGVALAQPAPSQPFHLQRRRPLYGPRVGRYGPQDMGQPPADLDLQFFGPTLDPRFTFTRTSIATYFDATGTMQTAASGAPRFDYDPATLVARGLLIEETRGNILFPSGDCTSVFTSAVANSVWTSNVARAPDGTTTMSRLAENAAIGQHYSTKSVTVTASTAYTFSVFAKAAENRYLQMIYDDGSANGAYVTFDLQTGTITGALTARGTGTAIGATITPAGNGGTYRLSISGIAAASTAARAGVILCIAGNPGYAPSYQGNAANGLLIWGAQLELGSFPTSYIPTVSAAVTRAVETAIMPLGTWYNQSAGTFEATFIPQQAAGSGTQEGPLRWDDGGDTNRAGLFVNTTGVLTAYAIIGGPTPINNGLGIVVMGAVNRASITYGDPLWRGQLKPNASVNGSGGQVALTMSRLLLAAHNSGQWQLNGWIQRLRYWKRALAPSELV